MIVAASEGYPEFVSLEAVQNNVEKISTRSAWDRGVKEYAEEFVFDDLSEVIEYEGWPGVPTDGSLLKDALLNGASDWSQYSWGGSSLIYNEDIAERLCTPSELKKYNARGGGSYIPGNNKEELLDIQARALNQAYVKVRDAVMKAAVQEQENLYKESLLSKLSK